MVWVPDTVRGICRNIITSTHYTASKRTKSRRTLPNNEPESILSAIKSERVAGPVVRARDVTDYGAVNFVADPFVYVDDDVIHLFFEVCNMDRQPTAVIGHSTSEDMGQTWNYNEIVFEFERHVSFPYIFESEDKVYFLPDLSNTENRISPVRLYEPDEFPVSWSPVVDIIDADHKCLDTVVFKYNGYWWAILGSGNNDELRVYFSDELVARDWTPHPENPVVTDRKSAGRPGGRPLLIDDRIVMFYQDCSKRYGGALRAFEITALSPTTYQDTPLFADLLLSGTGGLGWNSGRMHHLDLQFTDGEALVAVDGDVGFGQNRLTEAMWSVGFEAIPLSKK